MASPSEPCAALERRVAPALAAAASNTGSMPDDAVFEILLRLPAREVCRLRVVCRPWWSLLSNPHFVAAHAARHPLIVAGHHTAHRGHGSLCDIVDVLSGHVVKRVRPTWDTNELVVSTHLDLICTLRRRTWSFRLINPATGAVHALPDELADENEDENICDFRPMVVLGQVASTGKYKVLRVLDDILLHDQLCEVFMLDDNIHARWRAKGDPPDRLDMQSRVVVDGIVYLFTSEPGPDKHAMRKRIASFDLETEEWQATIQGPMISPVGDAIGTSSNNINHDDLALASLNSSLVVVHLSSSSMDLWFLIDFEKSLWVKQYSIQVNLSAQHDEFHVRPLMALDDERIVTYIGPRGLLRIYNPRTSMYTDVTEMGPRVGIGVYTGNLLSLANGAS